MLLHPAMGKACIARTENPAFFTHAALLNVPSALQLRSSFCTACSGIVMAQLAQQDTQVLTWN